MALQTLEWNRIVKEWSGLYTARNSDNIPDGYSPNLLNVRVNGSHIRGSLGYELCGSRNSSSGEITGKYTYTRNDGKERMVRVRDTGSAGVLEWYDSTNEEWYTLLSALTTGKRMGFTEFNTSSTNQMVCCNGVENMSVWTGAITRLTSAVLAGATIINVADTTDFPATGTIIYNGTEVAYTSKTATTFVVASAHASAGSNDGVAQAIDDSTHAAITKGNILLSAKDRLWIAGQPSAPNNFDYSDEGAAFTFTGGANRTDSGTEDFFNIGGYISGLAEKGDEIVVLGPDGADGFSFIYPTSTTKAPKFREIFRAKGLGCSNAASVFKVNNEVYFTNKNGIQAIGDLEGSEKVFNKSITRGILPTTRDYDFSESASIYHDKESILVVACKTDSDLPGNDVVLGVEFYEAMDEETGETYNTYSITRFDWPVNAWAILADELYFGSSYDQNSFKGFSTYQNDGAPRTIRYAMKRENSANPFQEKATPVVGVKGMIKAETEITDSELYNAGFLGGQEKTIMSTGAYVSEFSLNTIGAFAMGTNPVGAPSGEVGDLKSFFVYLDLGVDYAYSDLQLIFESETDGGTFLIDMVGFAIDTQGYAVRDDITI